MHGMRKVVTSRETKDQAEATHSKPIGLSLERKHYTIQLERFFEFATNKATRGRWYKLFKGILGQKEVFSARVVDLWRGLCHHYIFTCYRLLSALYIL